MKEIMNRGWIKLHRKLRESAIYNEGLVFLLIECLFSATHKDINIDYAGAEITLHAGQFVFGRHQWAKRLKINESTLYKRITKLTKYGILTVQNSNSFSGTIYQIEKWNEYQQEEQPSNSQVTAKEQLGNTNKNDKNYKNDKNITNKLVMTKVVPQKNIYIECLLKEFELLFGFPPTDKKSRFVAQAFRKNIEAFLKVFNPEITYERFENVVKTYFKWISNQDYAENIQRLETIKLKFPIWSTPKVTDYKKGNHANNEPKE